MKKIILLVYLFLTASIDLSATVNKEECKYYLSVCGMFRDEALYLKEWIEFHRLVGVEHFILYNNSSVDNYLEVLGPYVDAGIVELIDWPSSPVGYMTEQVKIYNQCISNHIGVSFWLALIDIDEFVVPVDSSDLPTYLSQFDEQEFLGAIHINWQLYGTSFLPSIPQDKLMVESLLLKAPWDYQSKQQPNNTVYKTIVRPHAIDHYKIHDGTLNENYYAFPNEKIGRINQKVQIDHIRINHYWTRAEDFFYGVKIGRRLLWTDKKYLKVMMQKLVELNQVNDPIMLQFAPELRQRMNSPTIIQE